MRRLIAALACRNAGSRLYGKPMQNLLAGKTILDQILDTIARLPQIEMPVLGISEGTENQVFVEVARGRGIPYIVGSEVDVLARLIACAEAANGTDVFRVTTECPFLYSEPVERAWHDHQRYGNDITATDGLPEGTHFEIFTLEALRRSHRNGTSEHRSENCSRYARQNFKDFRVQAILPEAECARMDLRLTVDYPEDLVVCRRIYEALQDRAPLIPLRDIVHFLDSRPDLTALLAPYTKPKRLWDGNYP
ncbi:hypothetical protein [Ferrovibrio sp.]|uniref:cytidylyltransferase domain-containing protein n=1 Tax=Ferrovibrio sp. TaxID=1917215 RepID=UPI000CAE6C2B|nr:hypothetical protein [Ferrovibrio sp.]PJI41896.1 MAG: acylneuraminate cytidylyltransferase [Ferrovibrio sp.]